MIKVKKRKILLLPGDGIGPEVIGEVKKIINWFNNKKSLDFEIDEDLAGGCSYDKHGTPITDDNGNDMPSVPIAVPLYFDAEISEIVVKTTGATIPPKAPIKSLVTKKNW
mgnify:CR=1 FL=1